MSVFFNSDFSLRSGWRCALYVIVFLGLLFANGALISLLLRNASLGESDVALLAINAWALTPPAVLALLFMTRFVDHVPVVAFGAGLHERCFKDLGAGLKIAALMLAFYSACSLVLSEFSVEALPHEANFWVLWLWTALILIVSAANEELLFRGYPLQTLMVAIGQWPAIVAVSALFGLAHHLNPNATWLGTLNTFLAGILLCLAYVRTRSLWFPYGIHVGWNLAIGPVFGFAVSGITMPSLWRTRAVGLEWVTGGTYGPEGGILGTGVMLTGMIAVVAARKVHLSKTVRSVLSEHAGIVSANGLPATASPDSQQSRVPRASSKDNEP